MKKIDLFSGHDNDKLTMLIKAPIRKILLLHLDELKDVLIKTNGAQPGDTQIISVIEEQIKELYHQISIFEL